MDKIGKYGPKGKVFQTFNNICKDHRDKIEVPDPLAVEDLISCKLNNKPKLARLITQYRDIFFPIFRKAGPSFFRVLQRMSFFKNSFSVTHSLEHLKRCSPSKRTPSQISNETWYAVVTGQGDIRNLIKRGGHRTCFHATMLTDMVIKVTFCSLSAQQISAIIFQCGVLYHTEFDFF